MLVVLFAQGENNPANQMTEVWEQVQAFVYEQGFHLALNLLGAIVVFVVGRWAAKLIRRICTGMLQRAKVDETLTKFLTNIIYSLALAFVVVAVLDQLGVNTTSFAAIVASAGLAIGLALQGSLSNFAAGVMLILFRPFGVGDFVNAGGVSGVVEEVRIFNTRIRTGDNVQIIIPNGQITTDAIKNYSVKETRRIDLVVGCGYADDLRAVKRFLEELLADDERILQDPEPVVAVNELGESSIDFVVRPWVKAADYWAVRWELNEKIKLGFDEQGFNIPYPSRDVYMHQTVG